MCGKQPGPPPPPPPTPQETALQEEYLKTLRDQRALQESFAPLLLGDSGYKQNATKMREAQQLQTNIDAMRKRLDTHDPKDQAGVTWLTDRLREEEEALARVQPQIYEKSPERLEMEKRAKEIQAKIDEATKRELELSGLRADRQERALRGELPVSEGTLQRKKIEFAQFKEAMARSGNPIIGDEPETAYSLTSPGAQSLESFRSSYKLVEDAERRGELDAGAATLMNSLSLTGGLGGGAYNAARTNAVGTLGSLSGGTGGLLSGYQGAVGQMAQERAQMYSLTPYSAGSSPWGATAGGALGGAATGAYVGSVVPGIGTAIGAGVGALAGGLGGYLSSR